MNCRCDKPFVLYPEPGIGGHIENAAECIKGTGKVVGRTAGVSGNEAVEEKQAVQLYYREGRHPVVKHPGHTVEHPNGEGPVELPNRPIFDQAMTAPRNASGSAGIDKPTGKQYGDQNAQIHPGRCLF